jgi:hypothetical protein
MHIVIGDANGADRAMQRQLAEWHYPAVEVFFVGPAPRNNVGQWPTRHIPTPARAKGFDYYSVKDVAMAREAECGLMLWDGESRGTLANVDNLVRDSKPVALYVAPTHRFVAIENLGDWADIQRALSSGPSGAIDGVPSQGELGLGAALETPKRRSRRRRTA